MKEPLVSIVMPAYNAGRFVQTAIDSILAQTYQNWELLVADDGSRDDTRDVIDSYQDARIRRLHNEKNFGYGLTCNKLFAACKGEYVTFQDADDISVPTRLVRQLDAFALDRELGICGTWATLISLRGDVVGHDRRPTADQDLRREIGMRNVFCGATVMVRATVLREVGGYREFFCDYGGEDYDWTYRIVERLKACNLPEELYVYRQVPGTMSKTVTVKKYICHSLVAEMGQQRASSGADVLMMRDEAGLSALVAKHAGPYLQDPALLFRESAAGLLSAGLILEPIQSSVRAVLARPTELINYRTLFYCLRRGAVRWAGRHISRLTRRLAAS